MKKILLLITCLILLSGCTKKIEKFDLNEKYYTTSAAKYEIDKNSFNVKIDVKDSFGLLVYMDGCTSCANFETVIDEFIEQKHISIYAIKFTDIDDTILKDKIKYTPSFVLINEGEIVTYLDASCNKDLPCYETLDGFYEWFTTYVNIKESVEK